MRTGSNRPRSGWNHIGPSTPATARAGPFSEAMNSSAVARLDLRSAPGLRDASRKAAMARRPAS